MTTTLPEPAADRTAAISRVIGVPAKYLFLAHSRPEHLKRWFGPVGYPVTTCDIDFRVGGNWRMVMTGPDGVEGPPFGGTYLEITPHSRIVYDNGFEDGKGGEMDLQHAGRMVMTTTFDEVKIGRQPESLRIDELQEITDFLQTGERKDWSLN